MNAENILQAPRDQPRDNCSDADSPLAKPEQPQESPAPLSPSTLPFLVREIVPKVG